MDMFNMFFGGGGFPGGNVRFSSRSGGNSGFPSGFPGGVHFQF